MLTIKIKPHFEINFTKQKDKNFIHNLAKLVRNSIRQTITTYLRFSKKHGWDYPYTGRLAKSFTLGKIEISDTKLISHVYSDAPQARILELGGTITPKHSQYLKVPVKHSRLPFTLPKEVELQLKAGMLYYGSRPAFVLARKVKIPAYSYIKRALELLAPSIPMEVEYYIDKAFEDKR